MKTLARLSTIDKAELLFQLFNDEIPDLLLYIRTTFHVADSSSPKLKFYNDKDEIPVEIWYPLAIDIITRIDKYGGKLCSHKKLFTDQLFGNESAMWTIINLISYSRLTHNRSFKTVIDILFNPYYGSIQKIQETFDQLSTDVNAKLETLADLFCEDKFAEDILLVVSETDLIFTDFEFQLNDFPRAVCIKLKGGVISVQLKGNNYFIDLNDFISLNIQDKIKVASFLEKKYKEMVQNSK